MPEKQAVKEWIKPTKWGPDYTVPIDLAYKIATEIQNGPDNLPVQAHIEESRHGGYANIWFNRENGKLTEQADSDREAFKHKLIRYDEETKRNETRRYFRLASKDHERALELFKEEFSDIDGNPHSGLMLSGKEAEVMITHPLFAKMFRDVLIKNEIDYNENKKAQVGGIFAGQFD